MVTRACHSFLLAAILLAIIAPALHSDDAPIISAISIIPSTAYVNSTLQCNVTAVDNESPSLNITYSWMRAILNYTSLVAGSGTATYAEGIGSAAGFNNSRGVTLGPDGYLYVADSDNHRVRKINTTTNQTYLVAGSGSTTYAEGIGSAAGINSPRGVTFGTDGYLYVAEFGNNRIRKINVTTNQTYLVAGSGTATYAEGAGSAASFSGPCSLFFGSDGWLYVTDYTSNRIRKINVTTNQTYLVAGSGSTSYTEGAGSAASFYGPIILTLGPDGYLYVTDFQHNRVRKINTTTNQTYLVAGNGTAAYAEGAGSSAAFSYPSGLSFGSDGYLYVTENGNHIRKINVTTNQTYFVAGSGSAAYAEGIGSSASFYNPRGISFGSDGWLYVADQANHRIRKIPLASPATDGVLYSSGSLNATNSTATLVNLTLNTSIAKKFYGWSCSVYANDGTANSSANSSSTVPISNSPPTTPIQTSPSNGSVQNYTSVTLACSGSSDADNDTISYNYYGDNSSGSTVLGSDWWYVTQGLGATYYWKCGAYDGVDYSPNSSLRQFSTNLRSSITSLSFGPSPAYANSTLQCNASAQDDNFPTLNVTYALFKNSQNQTEWVAYGFIFPERIVFGPDGYLYVTDNGYETITKVNVTTHQVYHVAGSNNSASYAEGIGTAARFDDPYDIAFGPDGYLYVADYNNNRVRKINVTTNQTYLVAGQTSSGNSEGIGSAASFDNPYALAFGPDGYLYVADSGNYRIRKINITTNQTYPAVAQYAYGFTFGPDGYLYVSELSDIIKINVTTNQTYPVVEGQTTYPYALAFGPDGYLYVANTGRGNIRKINTTTNQTHFVAGDEDDSMGDAEGTGPSANFSNPRGISFSPDGYLYISDDSIRRLWPAGITYSVSNNTASSFSYALNSSLTSKGDVWTCAAYSYESLVFSQVNYSNITISNSPPTSPGSLLPSGGENFTSDASNNISINWSASSDYDNDSMTYEIYYSQDGGTGWTYVASTASTSYWWNTTYLGSSAAYQIRVYANDSFNLSGASTSDNFSITHFINAAPTIGLISITPSQPNITSEIHCNITAIDSESSSISISYSWLLNGTNQTSLAGSLNASNNTEIMLNLTLSTSISAKGDNWSCAARAYDGTDNSATNYSSNITIQNSAPSSPSSLLPNGGENFTSNLSNNISINWSASSDYDNDSITYFLFYSSDGGSSWSYLASTASTSYWWNTTYLDSGAAYKVRIYANDSSSMSSNLSSLSNISIIHLEIQNLSAALNVQLNDSNISQSETQIQVVHPSGTIAANLTVPNNTSISTPDGFIPGLIYATNFTPTVGELAESNASTYVDLALHLGPPSTTFSPNITVTMNYSTLSTADKAKVATALAAGTMYVKKCNDSGGSCITLMPLSYDTSAFTITVSIGSFSTLGLYDATPAGATTTTAAATTSGGSTGGGSLPIPRPSAPAPAPSAAQPPAQPPAPEPIQIPKIQPTPAPANNGPTPEPAIPKAQILPEPAGEAAPQTPSKPEQNNDFASQILASAISIGALLSLTGVAAYFAFIRKPKRRGL